MSEEKSYKDLRVSNAQTNNAGFYLKHGETRDPHVGKYPQILLNDFKVPRRVPGIDNKSVELSRYIIRTYTNKGDTVLDLSMGMGRQGVASVLEKRSFIGFELKSEHFSKCKTRIKEAELS